MSVSNSTNRNWIQKQWTSLLKAIKQVLIRFRELFLGRTKHQTKDEKPSYLGRKMILLFGIFTFYSFIFFSLMNDLFKNTPIIVQIFNFLCGDNPYIFGISLSISFIELGLILCNQTILNWMFGKFYALKHLILVSGMIFGNYFFARYIDDSKINIYAILLILAMLWLIMQSVRIYWAARSGATRVEIKFSNTYSPIRYVIAQILPLLILGVLVFLSWLFRYGVVVYTLDYIAVHVADMAYSLYNHQMTGIMPTLYFGLLVTALFMLIQRILSRKRGSTKRAGVYDTLTFAIICFVMFLYAIYNIALYLLVDPEFLEAVNRVLSGGQQPETQNGFFFLIEFVITILFLIWVLLDLNKRFQKGFLFFTRDGFVIFLLGTVFAQTTARLGLVLRTATVNTGLADFIKYDYIVLPWLILIFLGFTIIVYWIRPQETSMFMHANEAAIDKRQKMMETFLTFFKREFIRRGERFEITDQMINSLQKITELPKGVTWSIIHRLNKKFVDVMLETKEDPTTKKKTVIFDFIPITERYQNSEKADKRAQVFLQQKFYENISRKTRKNIDLTGEKSSSSQSDSFIQALSVQYGRKVKEEESIKQSRKDEEFLIERAIDEETKYLVYDIIKKKYIERVKQISDFPEDFYFRISDIASYIEETARVPVGEVFNLVLQMAIEDWNLNISAKILDKKHPDDRNIEFLPIDDFEIYYALEEFRPEHLKEVKILMQLWFEKAIYFKRDQLLRLPPLKYDDRDKEFERSYRSEWFAHTMQYFGKEFTIRQKHEDYHSRYLLLQEIISDISGRSIETSTKTQIYNFLKTEYLKRIRKPLKYEDDFRFKISDITKPLLNKYRLSEGRVYPLLNDIAVEDWNFNLSKYGLNDEEDEEDRWIEFLPISDFEVYDALIGFRPEATKEIHVLMQTWFDRNIHYPRDEMSRIAPIVYDDEIKEQKRSEKSRWFAHLNQYCARYYRNSHKLWVEHQRSKSFQVLMTQIITGKINEARS